MRLLNLGLTAILAGAICFASCGDSKRNSSAGPGSAEQAGQAGDGGAPVQPEPVRCGSAWCRPIVLPDGEAVPTCCVDPSQGTCGAEVSTPLPGAACVPLTQPGEIDDSCSASPAGVAGLPLPPLPGCCNPSTQRCGYLISDFGGLLPFAPGCVDSTLLVPGEEPRACGDDGDGGGGPIDGAGGAGGIGPGHAGAGGVDPGGGGADGNDSATGGVSGANATAAGASGSDT